MFRQTLCFSLSRLMNNLKLKTVWIVTLVSIIVAPATAQQSHKTPTKSQASAMTQTVGLWSSQDGRRGKVVIQSQSSVTQSGKIVQESKQEFQVKQRDGKLRFSVAKPTRYWLGVNCLPISGLVGEQLSIDSGVAVESVLSGGPADGKLKRHDIILSLNEVSLKSVDDLVAQIQASGTKDITVKLLRKNKPITQVLRAKLRPAEVHRKPIFITVNADKQVDQKQLASLKMLTTSETASMDLPSVYIIRPGIQLGTAKDLVPSESFLLEANPTITYQQKIDNQAYGVSIDDYTTFAIAASKDKPTTRININPRLQAMGNFEMRLPTVGRTFRGVIGQWQFSHFVADGTSTRPIDDLASMILHHKTRVRNRIILLKSQQDLSKRQMENVNRIDMESRDVILADLTRQIEQMEKSLSRHREDLAITGEIFKVIQARVSKMPAKQESTNKQK